VNHLHLNSPSSETRWSLDQDPEWHRLSDTQFAHRFASVAVRTMLRAEMNHISLKPRSFIIQEGSAQERRLISFLH
jgi:hypothetical protein